jgi:multicomponent K+:H+ antiporter subunit C
MEALLASAIGLLTAVGHLPDAAPTHFPVILGLTFLSYAVNLFLFASGRLALNATPIIGTADSYTDPLPQALVLTAIVISFGMTAVIMMLAIGGHLQAGHDRIDLDRTTRPRNDPPPAFHICPNIPAGGWICVLHAKAGRKACAPVLGLKAAHNPWAAA